MQRLIFALIVVSSFYAVSLPATELQPWHGSLYSFDIRGSCLMQQFQQLDSICGVIKKPEFDAFYDFSAHVVIQEELTAEIELSALDSRHRLFGMEALRLTGRYFLLNDIIGDPVSFAAGITVSTIFDAARRNVATFDHGSIACEGHVAVGKELSCNQFWVSRVWGVMGIGIANLGWPWLRANFAWERNWWEIHQLKVFAESIWGFGPHKLCIYPSFHGYGSVNYQAVDVGVRYGFRLDNDTLLSMGYTYRMFGRNCPRNVNLVKLEVYYPFGF